MSTHDPDLEQFDEQFAGSEAKEGGEIKDGEYECTVERLEKRTNERRGVPQISWRFRIVGPAYAGRLLFRDVELKTDNLGIIKSDLRKVGLTQDKLSEAMASAANVIGLSVKVTRKTNAKGYANVYLDGLAGPPF
jgi:hypothetical protein